MSIRAPSILRILDGAGLSAEQLGVTVDECVAFCEARDVREAFVPDAVLSLACAKGNAAALAEFERRFAGEFAGALSRFRLDRASIDELSQIVREKLFVSKNGAAPKIADYAGRGPLVGWLRAVIVRTAIDYRRHEALEPKPADESEPLLDMANASDDPELEHIRAKYAGAFRDAVRDAIRALEADERNALRLHVAEGLTLEDVARIYGVHRATVARWIQSARENVLATTQKLLQDRLHLAPPEFHSLVKLCRSRLELSFSVPDAASGVTGSEPPN